MPSFEQHPVMKWGGLAVAVLSVVFTCAGAFVYLEDLKRSTQALHSELEDSIQEKKDLDVRWLELDREDHDGLSHLGNDIRSDLRLLAARLQSDGGLIYQLGLNDGMELCGSREGE